MSVKILVDMNLSPEWVPALTVHGCEAVHWSTIGNPHAPDTEIMDWARTRSFVVFTHDLDFGAALALTHATGPSVVQVRGRHVLPEHMSVLIHATIQQYENELNTGALVVIDENRSRVRILPL